MSTTNSITLRRLSPRAAAAYQASERVARALRAAPNTPNAAARRLELLRLRWAYVRLSRRHDNAHER